MAAGVLVCVVRAPKPLHAGDGLSWFGVTGATVVEYALTLLVTAALLVRAAGPLAAVPELRPLRIGLLVVCRADAGSARHPLHPRHRPQLDPHDRRVRPLRAADPRRGVAVVGARRHLAVFALLAVQVAGGVVCFTSLLDLDAAML